MSNEEKKELISEALKEQTAFNLKDVLQINHKPHPFMIGAQHVAYASDHHGGMLGEETCRKIPCAWKGCTTP